MNLTFCEDSLPLDFQTTTTMFRKVLLVIFLPLISFSQKYTHIEAMVKDYPGSIKTPEALAQRIATDFKTDEEKAVAIYTWLGLNIKYDVKEMKRVESGSGKKSFSGKSKEEIEQKKRKYDNDRIIKALKKRKGVCDHYSLIFKKTADILYLDSERIVGFAKNSLSKLGKAPAKADHAWNKVKINEEWLYLDPTWGAGGVNGKKFIRSFNYNYCLIENDRFNLNHIDSSLPKKEIAALKSMHAKTPYYWGAYIGSEIELINPSTAYVATKGSKTIEVRIKNFNPNGVLSYNFETAKKGGYLKPISVSDSITTFELPCDFKGKEMVHLLYNQEAIASFKIGLR